jgi:hypothetical protein
MARPLGDIAGAVLARLAQDGPMTMRELATAEQIHIRAIWSTMDRLVAGGRVIVVANVAVPWARRPVARYAVAPRVRVVPSFPVFHPRGPM